MGVGGDDKLIELYEQRREMLVRYLAARLGSREAAEDAVQELFLKLHKAERAETISNPGAFLFRAATNVAIDHIRQRQRASVREREWSDVTSRSAGGETVSDAPSAEAVVEARERLQAIVEALGDLSPQVRRVFIMHKFDGLSHKEVAAALGISKSTVEKHMIKALRRLMELKDDGL